MKFNSLRMPYFATGIALVIFYLILNFSYRPFVFENHLSDYHLADTLGSLFSIPIFTFFILSFVTLPVVNRWIIILLVVHLFIEASSIVLPIGVFDFFDAIALIVGALFSFLITRIANVQKVRLIPSSQA